MNEQISRLVDGEIEQPELDSVCALLKGDAQMITWTCYHTIGDALRGETPVIRNIGLALSRRLAQEATVIAPFVRSVSRPVSWAWAAAASLAAMGVVGWTAYSLIDAAPAGLAKAREAGMVRAAQLRPATIPADYLLAHQEYAPANALQGVGPYLRDVAASTPLRQAGE